MSALHSKILILVSVGSLASAGLTTSCFAGADPKVRPSSHLEFLFSEDNQIADSPKERQQSASGIATQNLIQTDKWLNQPLTRLDYVLMEIGANLNKQLSAATRSLMKTYFEKKSPYDLSPMLTFNVSYSDKTGRLFVKAAVDYVGKPKAPIKNVCNMVLSELEGSYPLKPLGYTWNNNALGILQRDWDPQNNLEYSKAVQTLAESTVLIASVSSEYEVNGKRGLFAISCSKQKADGPVTYFKFSKDISDVTPSHRAGAAPH